MRKFICISVALIMLVSVLSSCSKGSLSVLSSVDEDGNFVYSITRGKDGVDEAEITSKKIRTKVKENFGCNISIFLDSAREDFDGNYEILVGDTDREESFEAKNRLTNNRENSINDFIVAVINDKIVIQSESPHMLETAGDWFIHNFCGSLDDWSKLKKGYQFIYEHKNDVTSATNFVDGKNLGTFDLVLPAKCSYLVGMYGEKIKDFYKQYAFMLDNIEDIDEKQTNEIIIGDTTREESKAVKVDGDNYVIKVVNGNVVIKGGNDLATWRGAKAFLDEISKLNEGVGINWPEGYEICGRYDAKEKGAYTLNWNDEFEGNSIDFNKWGEYAGMAKETEKSSLGGLKCWQTPYGETPYPQPEKLKKLIYASGGNLHIGTQRVNDIDFVGGQISTDYTMIFRYGILEIKSKLPPEPCSLGYWINQFSFSKANYGFTRRFGGLEQARICNAGVDIIENFGSSNSFNANIHCRWTNNNTDANKTFSGHYSLDGGQYATKGNSRKKIYNQTRYGGDLSTDYHYYGMYWTDETMKFIFDGKAFFEYRFDEEPMGFAPFQLMSHFITECQMGDISYGKIYNTETDGDYYEHIIDYVRIYQNDEVCSQLITAWPQKEESGEVKVYYPEHPVSLYDE
ncbi:MAG: glycosyl hydrolase family protein [Ruminococcaceae bacterium]|nr:glycosyl hydrolase family protein [Oscillospiraceae bacterium]